VHYGRVTGGSQANGGGHKWRERGCASPKRFARVRMKKAGRCCFRPASSSERKTVARFLGGTQAGTTLAARGPFPLDD
jgi:hypothetical protein